MSAIAITNPIVRPPAGRSGQELCLPHVSWEDYERLGEIFRDRPNLRMTYDRGDLEFMTLSNEHEFYKKVISRLLEAALDELGIDYYSAGSMTFKRQDLDRGLEPDDCFWIAHEQIIRGRIDYNPASDPPPDLVIEVEVSRSVLNRIGIYAALKIPEIWRFDRSKITVLRLEQSGMYVESASSPTLLDVPLNGFVPFSVPDTSKPTSQVVREFRSWVAQYRKEPR